MKGQSVTHAAMHPTQSPSWDELLLIEVREEESKDEGKSAHDVLTHFYING